MTENEMQTILELVEFVEDESPEISCRYAALGCTPGRHVTGCIMATLAEANFLIHDYRKRIQAERKAAIKKIREETTCKWSGLSKEGCFNICGHRH